MDEAYQGDESTSSLNNKSNQPTLLNLIIEITPIGLAVVKSPDLIFQVANPAYRSYLPAADIDPLNQRYEDVWPPDDDNGFGGNVMLRKVLDTGEALDLDDHKRTYADGTERNFGLRLRRVPWDGDSAVLILIWDIADMAQAREKMEQTVRQREEELEAAVNECVEDMIEMERHLFARMEADRKDLSEKLHNGPMQDLYAILFQLHALHGELEQAAVIGALTPILDRIVKVNRALRKIYNEIRPSTLSSFGLASAINGHVRRLRESHDGIEFRLDLAPIEQSLPEDLQVALFRIYEAGVNNVITHAAAKRVDIRLSTSDEILLVIQDDGNGFTVPEGWKEFARNGQYGLMECFERARVFGGGLDVVSEPGDGCKLKVSIPRSAGE